MSVIKVGDLAYARVQVPDLSKAEKFFLDFGLLVSARTSTSLHLRAHDAERQVIIAQQGPRKLLSVAFKCGAREDLEQVASFAGTNVTQRDEPGGGWQVVVHDLDGNSVELVWGIEPVESIVVQRMPLNMGAERYRRTGDLCRPSSGPSHVLRLGHVVITSEQPDMVGRWYRDMFGLLVSDEVTDSDGNVILSFNRLDKGLEFVDHHVFQTTPGPAGGVHHISFEVLDVDDVHIGNKFLGEKGYRHMWGVGRHRQGSQIFDYWIDPFGTMYEHWTDTDLLNVRAVPSRATVSESFGPWGPPMPEEFPTQVA
jgi:catechol 2,3-dioxygenase-like lactoylglutathione lyase family enzyme